MKETDTDTTDTDNCEGVLTFTQAAKLLTKVDGKEISGHTIARWAREGLKSGPKTVKLRFGRIGSTFVTRPDWLQDFLQHTTGNAEGGGQGERRIG